MKNSLVPLLVAAWLAVAPASADPKPYQPRHELIDGNELVFVYIGGTNCGFCNDPTIKAAVIKARSMLAERADAAHRPFSATGVALDYDLKEGLAYLKPLGPFDQVMLGRDWFNSAVLDLMASGGDDAIIGVPQIIVYERTIEHRTGKYTVAPPRILARIPGTAIPLWVQGGAQLSEASAEKTTPATSP